MKVAVAYITGPRGFKGELAAIPYRADTQSLKPGVEVVIQKSDISQKSVIETVKRFKNRIALKLTGIDDENTALSWRGGDILLEAENLAALNQGEYYHFQIEGMEVYEDTGAYVGIVSRIETMAANDILTVKTENGEVLIPFIKVVVQAVDLERKRIIIKKIEGLY